MCEYNYFAIQLYGIYTVELASSYKLPFIHKLSFIIYILFFVVIVHEIGDFQMTYLRTNEIGGKTVNMCLPGPHVVLLILDTNACIMS